MSAPVRIAILTALLVMATYTVLAARHLDVHSEAPTDAAGTELTAAAALTAARADVQTGSLRAAVAAAADAAGRGSSSPIDAADLALKAAGSSASAAAVVRDGHVQAAAGSARGADWLGAAREAAAGGKTVWIGAPGKGDSAYAYAVAATSGGAQVVGAVDVSKLLAQARTPVAAVATSGGRLLAAKAPAGADQASTLQEAFGLNPAEIEEGQAEGKLPDGTAVRLSLHGAGDGGLVIVTGRPGAMPAASGGASRLALDIFTALAPLAIGGGLTLLLMMQSRRANAVHRAFSDTEQRFRLAVEAARCGIWEWDLKTDRVFMSDVTGAILGWGGSGVVDGREVLGRVAAEHRDRVRQALQSARTYGAFDVSFRAPDREGRMAWIDARGQAFDATDGGYGRIVGVMLDVTEERMAQARAQAAETRLRDAIESVSEAFVLWDRGGRLLMCNRNYRAFFSLEPKILKPGASRESVARFVNLAIKQDYPATDPKGLREVELSNGRWLQISERRTAEGGVVMTAADITAIKHQDEARRKNEEALQVVVADLEASQAQLSELARKYEVEKIRAEGANKAKSEFLANMSHELRTPLNAVNGFSEIMVGELFGPLGDARYKEYAQDILNSGQHLLALINDILDMAKIEAGKLNLKFEPIRIEDVAEDAVRLIRNRAESAGLELVLDLPVLPEVEADYRSIKQVMLNLLSNALKFTPRGGQVILSADADLGDRIRIAVRDTGIGISAEDLERLAKPFEQIESQHSKTQQGTGLGLALTKSLVEMHQGMLKMESAPGEGTTVSVVLPLHQPTATSSSASYAA
jgi:two-component system cell cycle sensor histidine kinase PleC